MATLQMSQYLENALANHTLRHVSYTSPTTVYLALLKSEPSEITGGTEVTGGSYARQTVAFSAPVDGFVANSTAITFPSASADWGTITHWAIYDDPSAGNMLYFGEADIARTVTSGNQVYVAPNRITVTLD